LSVKAHADFVKTSTGFSSGGATVEDVSLMSRIVRDKGLGVKAAGNVRSLADLLKSGRTPRVLPLVLAGWLQSTFGWTFRLNAVTAGIGLSLAVIPIVYTVCEDAFTSVPQTYRDGSVAMGASSWQTASRVVLPAAMPGVLAACILGFGRAIGETMIVLMASGNAAILSLLPTDSIRTFSATIAAELGEVVVGSPHYHVLFFIGAFLFLITFVINLLGHWWVSRLQKKLQGAS